MTLISGTLPNFTNGVSQQPPWARLANQVTSQVNFMSSLVAGLTKRPGSRHMARIRTTRYGTLRPFLHLMDRDASNRFVVIVAEGTIRVFDLDGVERTVLTPDGTSYLTASTESAFVATSVADYTFIVNRTVTPALTTAPAAQTTWGHAFVRLGAYSQTYEVWTDGVLRATYTTSATDASTIRTENIAEQLRAALATNLPAAYGVAWTVERKGSVVRFRRNDGNAFTLSVRDSAGDGNTVGFIDRIQRFSLLPSSAWNGQVVRITGVDSGQFYYVEFEESTGTWKECARVQDRVGPSPATMPHRLVRNTDGTFTFSQVPWVARDAGDADASPHPSFVGQTINDVFFHKGRLGFLAGENVVLSAAGDYFRFYPDTIQTVTDDAPIDLATSSTRISLLRFVAPFDGSLMLFSDDAQFLLSDTGILSPKTASISPVGSFAALAGVRAQPHGRGVLFCQRRGEDTALREYLVDTSTGTRDALDLSSHVPTFVSGLALSLAVARNDDTAFIISDASDSTRRLFVYKWYWEGSEKLQSAWSEWQFNDASGTSDRLLAVATYDNNLLVILEREGHGVYLERIPLGPFGSFEGAGFSDRLLIDRKVSLTSGTYSSTTDRTTFTLPYPITSSSPIVAILGETVTDQWRDTIGTSWDTTNGAQYESTTTFSLPGDLTGCEIWFGYKFSARVVLSQINVAQQDGRSRRAITDGNLSLRYITFNVSNTQQLRFTVDRGSSLYQLVSDELRARQPPVASYERPSNIRLFTGTWRVPIFASNQATLSLESTNPFPCSILSADWEGVFVLRSRRT
ncbi:hypothetical protein NON00_02305 [Roseomonas sp. GC11]|uniref:phage nozzle protein n=1 Tax=Roseomonas sp. GC11 TaxID=2950546 RepID=UPI00210F0E0C|nr:hypothetical protein [Roseomonas sp. GC11]MCQ4158759.1 hypothetical protein [Roseomonas sp. GC11]